MAGPVPDRALLAGRIQGFGNVNPPPLEDETGTTMAKRAVARLGDMVGEEVMLTVEDFREKGAVGAVKDAVADAGDILIDGVSGLIGWIRGDPPVEEEGGEKTEDATRALSNGPAGAAYGISQASPTGGINAVWVMPDEADPAALATLAAQQGGLVAQQNDPRVPKNIQPYQPPPGAGRGGGATMPPQMMAPSYPLSLPGGPMIAPYQPAPSGPGGRPPPFVPGAAPGGFGGIPPQGRWGPGGYNPSSGAGAAPSSAPAAPSGAKGLVERIAKGEVLVGPEVAKRLVSQCQVAKTTGKQLGEIVCERARRLYLGLDGSDPAEADAALARLLGLVDALAAQPGAELAKAAVEDVKRGVSEELLSLRSSAKHKDTAEPILRRLGLVGQAPEVDLLGGGGGGGGSAAAVPARSAAAPEADLLGGGAPSAALVRPAAKEADLLGGGGGDASADLLGGVASSSTGVSSLDPLLAGPTAAASGSSLLAGLSLDTVPAMPAAGLQPMVSSTSPQGAAFPKAGTLAAGAFAAKEKKDEDAFGFVGAEMSKAKDGQKA